MKSDSYVRKKLFAGAVLLLVIGGLNLGAIAVFKKDFISDFFGKNAFLTNLIFLFIGIAAVCIGMYRDSYLPFLGQTVMPCALLNPQTPKNADFEVEILLRPGVKAMYWAAEPANKDLQYAENWRNAYSDFKNAGVVIADGSGRASLKVRKPQPYTVPLKGELKPHIHYRVCEERGIIGPIQTVTLDSREYFKNIVKEQEVPETVEEKPQQPEQVAEPVVDAMETINKKAIDTAKNSRMVETGAQVEFISPLLTGADYDAAYQG